MFKQILVPIDGSPTAALAVAKALGLAKAFGATVTAIYVIDPYPFTGVGTEFAYGQDQYFAAAKAEAGTALEAARTTLEAGGVAANRIQANGKKAAATRARSAEVIVVP